MPTPEEEEEGRRTFKIFLISAVALLVTFATLFYASLTPDGPIIRF